MNNEFAIGKMYDGNGVEIVYGKWSAVLEWLNSKTERTYGFLYSTEEKMQHQLEYYKQEQGEYSTFAQLA